ncbi:host specificity factor TipJ family phage tail protein [Enterobacter kobei]|uniref:host specificity factor TipJ family phage tail protein n=1 Tax=Enterobacter kobei TaxID=208224 RepID=UPI003D33B1DF
MILWPPLSQKPKSPVIPRSKVDPSMSRKSVSKMERDIEGRYYAIKVALKALFDQRLTGREREVNSHYWHFLCHDHGEDMRLYQVNAGKFIYDMSAQELAELLKAVQSILDDYLLDGGEQNLWAMDYVVAEAQRGTLEAFNNLSQQSQVYASQTTLQQLLSSPGYPAAVFNRANMKTDEYKMTYEATLPGGYDGVQVSYVHQTTNNKTYINYRVLNGSIVEQEAENPNKLEIVGFRNEYQARERALRETKRLIYSRVKMNAKVFEDGIIQVGSVIQMPDIYDSNQQQGYITGRSGNNFDTSEPITFAGSMYVLVTDSLGNPTLRYLATARSDTRYGFTAAVPGIQLNIWDGDTVQLPSRYLIATVEELNSQLWTVNSIKPNTDNTVSLTVAEYSDAIYQ